MNVEHTVDRLRHHGRRPLARTPYLWDATMAVRPSRRVTLARRDTAIVIDGFSRSGNTYSVAAFTMANGRDLHVGRHLHGAPHILRAARLHLPTVVLIRRPADAVSSYLVRRPALTPDHALSEYLDFYRTAWRAHDRFVVGLFETVITDFGAVLLAVNERFRTSFELYEATPENEAAAFEMVEELNRLECRGQVVETHVGRPSPERALPKRDVLARLQRQGTQRLLHEADALYEQYGSLAVNAPRTR